MRSVEPEVNAGSEQLCPAKIVIVHVNDRNYIARSSGGFKHFAYLSITRFIPRVGLAPENDLERPGSLLDDAEPVQIGEEEISPLILRSPSCKAQSRNVFGELYTGCLFDFAQQFAFGL